MERGLCIYYHNNSCSLCRKLGIIIHKRIDSIKFCETYLKLIDVTFLNTPLHHIIISHHKFVGTPLPFVHDIIYGGPLSRYVNSW